MHDHRHSPHAGGAEYALFGELGLRATAAEPRRVYCAKCGGEIDPLTKQTWGTQRWWQCPRGCNRSIQIH